MNKRFSLLSLIGIVTVTGFLISLSSTFSELRETNAQLEAVSAEIKSDKNNAAHNQVICDEYRPYVASLEKTYTARMEMKSRARTILQELIPAQSKIVPVEGKISIRRIPAIREPSDHRSGYAIFVPDSCKCEIRMLFNAAEDALFEGFEPESTFPLHSGLNEVMFHVISGNGSTQMRLTVNRDVVAKAVAEGSESRGGSYSNPVFDPQVDYSLAKLLPPAKYPRLPRLLKYTPNFDSTANEPQQLQPRVELHLRLAEGKVNSGG